MNGEILHGRLRGRRSVKQDLCLLRDNWSCKISESMALVEMLGISYRKLKNANKVRYQ